MSELPIKQESQIIRITRRQHREEVQVLVHFPYCLDLYPRYKQLDGRFKYTNMSWWPKGVGMAGLRLEDFRESSSTKHIKKAGINPKSKERNELPLKSTIKAKRWSEVRSALDDHGI